MEMHPVLKAHWPILVTAAGCVAAFATLSADVRTNKTELDQVKAEAKADHDAIVRMDERTKTMAYDVTEIKASIKELAKR